MKDSTYRWFSLGLTFIILTFCIGTFAMIEEQRIDKTINAGEFFSDFENSSVDCRLDFTKIQLYKKAYRKDFEFVIKCIDKEQQTHLQQFQAKLYRDSQGASSLKLRPNVVVLPNGSSSIGLKSFFFDMESWSNDRIRDLMDKQIILM